MSTPRDPAITMPKELFCDMTPMSSLDDATNLTGTFPHASMTVMSGMSSLDDSNKPTGTFPDPSPQQSVIVNMDNKVDDIANANATGTNESEDGAGCIWAIAQDTTETTVTDNNTVSIELSELSHLKIPDASDTESYVETMFDDMARSRGETPDK